MASPTYELTYVISGVLNEQQTQDLINRVGNFISDNDGEIVEADEWGSRRLAYQINNKRTGYYVTVHFDAPGAIIPRLERALQIEDDILRYLTLRLDAKMLRDYRKKQQQAAAEETPAEEAAEEQA